MNLWVADRKSVGCRFDSYRAHHLFSDLQTENYAYGLLISCSIYVFPLIHALSCQGTVEFSLDGAPKRATKNSRQAGSPRWSL